MIPVADKKEIFTIGHSNHELAQFVALLQRHCISVLADVRSQPFSKFHPRYNRETLETFLKEIGISYVFLGIELGARRTERECYVQGRADYREIAKLSLFNCGLEKVRKDAETNRVALICCERDPITCHRNILICRHLRCPEISISHILADGSLESNETAEARLLKLMGLHENDLFVSKQELIEQAYDLQGTSIAYSLPSTEQSSSCRGTL